jgi:hypothetical protein
VLSFKIRNTERRKKGKEKEEIETEKKELNEKK